MVKATKDYGFTSPDGPRRLLDLFAGRQQLIVYHFMFDPSWGAGCLLCTGYVNDLGDLKMLQDCTTAFALVSRASSAELEAYQALEGWRWPAGGMGRFATQRAAAARPRVAPPAEPRGPRTRVETISGVAEPCAGTAPGWPARPRGRA